MDLKNNKENMKITFEVDKIKENIEKLDSKKSKKKNDRKRWWCLKYDSGKSKKIVTKDSTPVGKDTREESAVDIKPGNVMQIQKERRKNAAIGENEVKSNVETLELYMFLDNLKSWGII